MPPVKKLRDILDDTLSLLADLEQRHRNVLIQFTCYRNNRLSYQSTPMKRSQLLHRLPQACRQERATAIALLITGNSQQHQSVTLHQARYTLAAKEQERTTYERGGLGSFDSSSAFDSPPAMSEAWGSGGGLGAVQETASIVNQIVADELFRKDHQTLQREAETLRLKVTTLEQELKEQRDINEARDMVKERIEQLTPYLPLVAQLVGPGTQAGRTLNGLAGISNHQIEANDTAQDDEHTTAAIGLVRGFMSSLHPSHKGQLLWVMQRVQKEPSMITRIAQFIQSPPSSTQQAQQGNSKQKPEHKQDAAQHENR